MYHRTAETGSANTMPAPQPRSLRSTLHILHTVDATSITEGQKERDRLNGIQNVYLVVVVGKGVALLSFLSVGSKSLALKHLFFYFDVTSDKAQNETRVVLAILIRWLEARMEPFSNFEDKQKHSREKRILSWEL